MVEWDISYESKFEVSLKLISRIEMKVNLIYWVPGEVVRYAAHDIVVALRACTAARLLFQLRLHWVVYYLAVLLTRTAALLII